MWALAVTQMHNYSALKIYSVGRFVDEFNSFQNLETEGGQTKSQTLALPDQHVQKLQRIKINSWTKH